VIVRSLDTGTLLITQPAHAHLARAVMEHATGLAGHPRRDPVLLAIGEHDNGWAEEDAEPTVDAGTGAVVDFVNASLWVRHTVWPRGVARLADDPWAAALVAQHAITVYDRFRSDADWTTFFEGMEAERDAMLRASGLAAADLAHDYPFVRLGDLISLTFCTGWTEPQTFAQWTVERSGSRVSVTPDPFGGATIPIAITALEIRKGPFSSNEELRAALDEGLTMTLRGEVAGI
jgi:hypothetical protein